MVQTPSSGPPIRAGEFFLGGPDEEGPAAGLPRPEILTRNGSYLAYPRMQEHVGAFRNFLSEHGETPEQQERVAAKLMGRRHSGASLVLAPSKDEPSLGADLQCNNDFT
jgi:deferrochelatase/peroxidase EfeB